MRSYTGDDAPETALPKGDVTDGVVRAGRTVRRPAQPQSPAVAAYLDHLEQAGFDGAPRFLGRDGQGRDVLTFLDGAVAGAPPEEWAADPHLLASVGALQRELHDASAGFLAASGFAAPGGGVWGRDLVPPPPAELAAAQPEAELVTHLDTTPQNTVVREGRAAGFIDFDLAGPAARLVDVANTARHWAPLVAPEDRHPTWPAADPVARVRVLADGYGLSEAERRALPDLAIARCDLARERLRTFATHLGGGWARMWDEGAGQEPLRRRAWLGDRRTALLDALLG
ncbi:phosphotransferase [Nocardiopsis coralliicola]